SYNGSVWAEDNPAQPSWQARFDSAADTFTMLRIAPSNGATSALLVLDNAGGLTLASAAGTGTIVTQAGAAGATRFLYPGGISCNAYYSGGWKEDDSTKPGYLFSMNATNDQAFIQRQAAGNGATVNLVFFDGSGNMTIAGATATKASGTTWANPSDRRLKEDIESYTTGLQAILALEPRTFVYNGKGGSTAGMQGFGFIADEVEPIMPEMVGHTQTKLDPADEADTTIQTLDTSTLILALVNAVKELAARVVALEAHS
ncbi:MAG TPA: tail fiber domain-containing protein, partial [Steroidobacteraceae bacterium]